MNILPPQDGHPGGAIFSAVPSIFVNGRMNAAATLGMVVLRAGVLFTIAALAYRVLQTRLTPMHRYVPTS